VGELSEDGPDDWEGLDASASHIAKWAWRLTDLVKRNYLYCIIYIHLFPC
jgi:hypothetical protein